MFIFSAKSLTQMYRRLRFVREYALYQRTQGELLKQQQELVENKHKDLEKRSAARNAPCSARTRWLTHRWSRRKWSSRGSWHR